MTLTFDLPTFQSSGDPGTLHPVNLPDAGDLVRLVLYPDLITTLDEGAM